LPRRKTLPSPRPHAEQLRQQREYRKTHTIAGALVVQSEVDTAKALVHLARQLSLRVPYERNHRCPDTDWILGMAIQLGLPALREYLDTHKLLPVRTEQ
jgi:hypothetical protein